MGICKSNLLDENNQQPADTKSAATVGKYVYDSKLSYLKVKEACTIIAIQQAGVFSLKSGVPLLSTPFFFLLWLISDSKNTPKLLLLSVAAK